MDRKIKFRAWDEKTKTMMPHVSILLIDENAAVPFRRDMFHNSMQWDEEGLIYRPILMQFTGLHDKNGVEVYAGDLLPIKIQYEVDSFSECSYISTTEGGGKKYMKVDISPCLVEENDNDGGWQFHNFAHNLIKPFWACYSDIVKSEVIGNVFQNPELLNPAQ